MADKKDSPADKGSSKPGDTSSGASGKKPRPLLDLKATEVRGASSTDGARSQTSHLKGAPDSKNAADNAAKGGSSTSTAAPSGTTGSAKPVAGSVPPFASGSSPSPASSTTSKMASVSPPSGARPGASDTTTAKGPASASGAAVGAAAAEKPSSGPSNIKSSNVKSSPSSAGSAKPPSAGDPPPPAQRSGGGFFSTVSHLAAGVVGGAIALFAAEPIEQQLGFALTSAPKMPAALEQRLAALEARPAGGGNEAIQRDVAQLSDRVAATQKRLDELDALSKQVASLSSDVSKARSTPSGDSAPAAGAGNAATSDAQSASLRARLAKLESALTTLSSATGSNGQPSGIAPLAKFSARFADLESTLNTQISSLRKSLMTEMDNRMAATSDATAKAVAGAERLDREVSDIKTDAARLAQRSTVLKTASDKLTATTQAIGEQAAELKVELDGLKGKIEQELAKVARPADVKKAIAPVSAKVASIEKNLGSVLASETARKENAERIVLSLELSNLKRVLDRGAPYGAELADVKKIAGGAIDFGPLEAYQDKGVPSGQELTRQFSSVAFKIINAQEAPKDDSSINRLLSAAKSIVQVRRTDIPAEEKTAEAAVARIEKRLKNGDMSGALSLAEKLPDQSKAPAKDWMSKLAARAGVDRAIAQIENQLKASLGGAPEKKS